ncbi:DJ-1/PfpI family protein [Actinoplanes sp. NPDC024001]|uniref:GlxA family transcriptional regulator n=1 Tax=Actinoplanes sp. NPDC024001 TaxID=3154598 RepID=UPI0033DD3DD6
MPRVVFLLIPHVHLLDVAGPAQVFSTAADLGHQHTLSYVAEDSPVSTVQALPVHAEVAWPALRPEDLIMVPGWRGPARLPTASTIQRLREHHAAGGAVAGICAGADALGMAGLLDGRRCTTHHAGQDELARRYPAAEVVRDVLYIEDQRVVTSAGVASGIDVALHILGTRVGPAAAGKVARAMIVYAARHGTAPQISTMLRHRHHHDDMVHLLQDLIDARFTERLTLPMLADAAGYSERTVTRLFRNATGLTPLAYQNNLRREHAEYLLGQGATVEAAARQAGYSDPRSLRRLRSAAGRAHDTSRAGALLQ